MILKSYIVEQNVAMLKDYRATLIYGQNAGIKDDIKEAIKGLNKNSEIITFFENDILKNNSLYENIFNQSLFSEKKVILIQEASDKIFNLITECLEKESNNVQIYIFSESLEKKSKLRSWFEKDPKSAIFPCYEDNDRTLISYVNKELKGYSGLSGEITNLIISNSNMDRKIIKSELVKIKFFFIEKKINMKEIIEVLNIKSDSGFDQIRDKALSGEKEKINKLLSETEILNEEAFFYLNILNYRINRLKTLFEKSQNNVNNFEQALESLRPTVFWKDKPIILQQLRKWSQKKVEEIITKIAKTEALMKKNSYLRNDVIVKDLIIHLTNKASTSS